MIRKFFQNFERKNVVIFLSILFLTGISTFTVLQKIDSSKKMISGVNTTADFVSDQDQTKTSEPANNTESNTQPSSSSTTKNSTSENSDTTTSPSQNSVTQSPTITNNPTNLPTTHNTTTATSAPTPTSTPQPTNTPTQNNNVQVSFKIYWENNKPVYDYTNMVCIGNLEVVWGHFYIIDPQGNTWNTGNHDFRTSPCSYSNVKSSSLEGKPLGEYTYKAVFDELGITKTVKATLSPPR